MIAESSNLDSHNNAQLIFFQFITSPHTYLNCWLAWKVDFDVLSIRFEILTSRFLQMRLRRDAYLLWNLENLVSKCQVQSEAFKTSKAFIKRPIICKSKIHFQVNRAFLFLTCPNKNPTGKEIGEIFFRHILLSHIMMRSPSTDHNNKTMK